MNWAIRDEEELESRNGHFRSNLGRGLRLHDVWEWHESEGCMGGGGRKETRLRRYIRLFWV